MTHHFPSTAKPILSAAVLTLLLSITSINHVSGFVTPWGINIQQTRISPLEAIKRGGRPRGPVRTIEVKPPMNGEIKQETLRIVVPTAKGKDEPLGVMSKSEALAKAKEMGDLDVILINENSDPPVCKIVDYSKYRYMKEKKAKELKKKSKASELKEVKMSYKIDIHDYEVRKKNAIKFLNQGNRVKCTVIFKGREVQFENIGRDLLVRLSDDLSKLAAMEGRPKKEGRNLSCIISPKAELLKSIADKRRAEEKAQRKKRDASKKEMDAKMAAAATAAGVAVAETDEDIDEMEDEIDGDEVGDLLGEKDDLVDDLFG
mmetsp:Transcript_12094/g.15090  ORF Transcript_12094/g.15090 Transcript_12094/m.15090 type:complete len:317 (+) Transcript_12094:104-1054(+)|eukprot:CAMPEP_0172496512 /NCGR_PEP_ID=MMETSP1066-20121228/88525_1 /TAXON_ID=671091 /ORGANISM="Coscinodiscus wailesii, Strain CCMP2513" /LENGTH=316 /DNA_ID=CAMNT_0013268843 /DNA_START=104 /DNA_END=1054 /DNA_ORIENTATION=+